MELARGRKGLTRPAFWIHLERCVAMRRLCASLVLLVVPLLAAGPAVAASSGTAPLPPTQTASKQVPPASLTGSPSDSASLPSWHADNGQSWVFLTDNAPTVPGSSASDSPLDFHGLGFASGDGGSFEYMLDPRWKAHARVHQKSWLGASTVGSCLLADSSVRREHCTDSRLAPSLLNSGIGATFIGSGYSVGMGVSATRPTAATPVLPRVVPRAPLTPSVDGLPFASLQGSTSVHARGRLAVGNRSGIDLGASVGRIRLLPGNVLGIDTLGQKSLSVGLDSGSVSGRIVGRIIQPEAGPAAGILGPKHSWTSIDLGVTWHLPWQGSLSFGTQNLFSSGHAPKPKKGPKPDQSRIPYVQYHQDF